MAQYTSNIGLHQWEPSDHFLRTDFNQDFSKIDAGFSWLEGALVRSGYEALQARLAAEAEGKKIPLGRGIIFDSFQNEARVSFSGGCSFKYGGGVLLDTGPGLVNFEDHFGTDEYGYLGTSGNSGHLSRSFAAAGNGTLHRLTFNLRSDDKGMVTVYFKSGAATLWSEHRYLSNTTEAHTFSPNLPLKKGLTYSIQMTRSYGPLWAYFASGGDGFGYRAECTPLRGTSGTVTSTAQNMDPFRTAQVWVRHSGGTVSCEIQRGGGSFVALTRMGSRSTVDCRGTACTETEFRLPRGQAMGGATRVRLTVQNSTDVTIYDYGALFL